MRNVAMINLEINSCTDCPYYRSSTELSVYRCAHELSRQKPYLCLQKDSAVPDSCPFVIERLKKVLANIEASSSTSIPKRYIACIERKQKDDPSPKFGFDHSWTHIINTTKYGLDFLHDCVAYGYLDRNSADKEELLFKISVYLHNIGLAESAHNHAAHSAELAKRFFSNCHVDIDIEDACTIIDAIRNHSDGAKTHTITDATLILADKLDLTRTRFIRATNQIALAMSHITNVQYRLFGNNGTAKGATLQYITDGKLDISALKTWPKAILIPKTITEQFLQLPEFHFLVDYTEIDLQEMFRS